MTALPSGGCIRLYPANHATPGPRWHINAAHHTIGLLDTSEQPTIDSAGFLVVGLVDELGQPNTLPVVDLDVSADETLTARGIWAGCSNGGPIIRIRLYMVGVGELDLSDPEHWALAAGAYCNVWVRATHDAPEPV